MIKVFLCSTRQSQWLMSSLLCVRIYYLYFVDYVTVIPFMWFRIVTNFTMRLVVDIKFSRPFNSQKSRGLSLVKLCQHNINVHLSLRLYCFC